MSQFRFAHSEWIHLLWGIAILGGLLVWLELRGRTVLDRFVSRVMQARLVARHSLPRRLAAVVCILLACALLVFALMRPQWGMTVQRAVRVDAQIMVCLDVSKSMLAEDVAPSRLERAKIELDALLGLLGEGEQVGLIAFAGKAAVLCPLTTDFGFLRLILAEAEPSSIGLGGTQIGVAIRQAVDGFRQSGDVNRLLLLLTDGEDHESYPVQAAEAAREKGVKIVCIGFGDEAGSKIEVTDPRTGARSFVQDRNGQDVVSRLAGATLREIATITEGAYVPAGTGALDLESIYRAHIATLLRGRSDGPMQVVRQEAYQWVVLAAVVALLLGLLLATPLRWQTAREAVRIASPGTVQAAVWLGLLMALTRPGPLRAQPAAATPPPAAAQEPVQADDATPDGTADAAAPAGDTAATPTDVAPREAYNRAVAMVRSQPDQAEQYLNVARREAGGDGELRYRTLYNLGWVEVVRADARLPDHAEQALPHLQQAANRFREAIRIRPDSTEARHNLEIVSRRILELSDALAQRNPADLAHRLDELIQQMRAHQAELQEAVGRAGEEVAPAQTEAFRDEFRRLGGTQRPIIADLERVGDSARQELDALNAKPTDQTSPADRLRSGQINHLLTFLDSGLQRLNQSRSLTRRLQANRAFRRWSAGLSDTKRARDQLRNPVEILSQLLADSAELAALTRSLAAANTLDQPADQPPASDAPDHSDDQPEASPPQPAPAPTWLTREYLQEEQAAGRERTRELQQVLAAVVASHEPDAPGGSLTDSDTAAPDSAQQQILENIQRALPPLGRAADGFERAETALNSGSLEIAVADQSEAITALAEAWECFFDIRRLIEILYRDEQIAREACGRVPTDRSIGQQMAVTIAELQHKNRGRAARLDAMLECELQQAQSASEASGGQPAPSATGGAAAGGPLSPEDEAQRARSERARGLVAAVAANLDRSLTQLNALGRDDGGEIATEDATASPSRDARWTEVETAADAALYDLEELRRLFFSLVEHLRDTAQRQAELAEQTQDQSAAALAEQTPERIGPLGLRQHELQQVAQALAMALEQQSAGGPSPDDTAAPTPGGGGGTASEPVAAAAAAAHTDAETDAQKKTLAQAAELVTAARKSMGTAAERLDTLAGTQPFDPATDPFPAISAPQREALEKLAAAIALLDPNQPPPEQPQAGQQQQQDEGATQQNQDAQEQQQQQQQQQQRQQENLSANQLLQLIRDREAQRREDRQQRSTAPPAAVDKDW